MPIRCQFIIDFCLLAAAMICGFTLGAFIKGHKAVYKYLCIITLVTLILPFVFGVRFIQFDYMKNVINGSYSKYEADVKQVYDYIDQCPDENVVVESLPQRPEGLFGFYLNLDKNNWVNTSVAGFFEKESVRLSNE